MNNSFLFFALRFKKYLSDFHKGKNTKVLMMALMNSYLDRPIIFIGFPRSGTTIISEIIMQHNSLAWVSNYQAHFPKNKSINLLRNLFHNPLWRINGQKEQLNKVSIFNNIIFIPSEAYQFWNTITGRNFSKSFMYNVYEEATKADEIRAFFYTLVQYQNRKRIAFKITGPSRIEYLLSIFPDAIFVRIKREVLPTLRSLLKVRFWNESRGKKELWWQQDGIYTSKELNFAKNPSTSAPLLAALQYYKINEIHYKEHIKTKVNIIDINYESFINNPYFVINDLLSKLYLDEDSNVIDYMNKNNIYNRNKHNDHLFSKEFDFEIQELAIKGINN